LLNHRGIKNSGTCAPVLISSRVFWHFYKEKATAIPRFKKLARSQWRAVMLKTQGKSHVGGLGRPQSDVAQRILFVFRKNTPKGCRQTKFDQCNQTSPKQANSRNCLAEATLLEIEGFLADLEVNVLTSGGTGLGEKSIKNPTAGSVAPEN
jgi:hypothetical protein